MSKAAQGFFPRRTYKYAAGKNPRRTQRIGKIAIYGWKHLHVAPILSPHIIQRLGNLAQGAYLDGFH